MSGSRWDMKDAMHFRFCWFAILIFLLSAQLSDINRDTLFAAFDDMMNPRVKSQAGRRNGESRRRGISFISQSQEGHEHDTSNS